MSAFEAKADVVTQMFAFGPIEKSVEELLSFAFACDLFCVVNPDTLLLATSPMKRLSNAFGEMLDAAS
jgi:hypothetical protein